MKAVRRDAPAPRFNPRERGARDAVYRVLDVNLNRLREALRVVEEYFRFVRTVDSLAVEIKVLRHSLQDMERALGRGELLESRDTRSDPFASVNREEELDRHSPEDVLAAGLKRAQEAARVIEEYVKLTGRGGCSEQAKRLRFTLYDFEKRIMERPEHGQEQNAGQPA